MNHGGCLSKLGSLAPNQEQRFTYNVTSPKLQVSKTEPPIPARLMRQLLRADLSLATEGHKTLAIAWLSSTIYNLTPPNQASGAAFRPVGRFLNGACLVQDPEASEGKRVCTYVPDKKCHLRVQRSGRALELSSRRAIERLRFAGQQQNTAIP